MNAALLIIAAVALCGCAAHISLPPAGQDVGKYGEIIIGWVPNELPDGITLETEGFAK